MHLRRCKTHEIRKFDLWYAELPAPLSGNHVIAGCRPVIVISSDAANVRCPVVSVIPLTTRLGREQTATHVLIRSKHLKAPSRALCEQVMSLDKALLSRRLGSIEDAFETLSLHHALAVQLGLAA